MKIMKMTNFRGDLTDILAKTIPLTATQHSTQAYRPRDWNWVKNTPYILMHNTNNKTPICCDIHQHDVIEVTYILIKLNT